MRRMGDTLGQGPPEKNASFRTPPPPPPLKAERSGGSGIQSQPLMKALVPQPFRCVPSLYPIPDPPPPVKGRTVEGVRNPLSVVDLRAARSTIDLSAFFILQARMQQKLRL
jgi:hypothetical protein